jgi:hypothetical protein
MQSFKGLLLGHLCASSLHFSKTLVNIMAQKYNFSSKGIILIFTLRMRLIFKSNLPIPWILLDPPHHGSQCSQELKNATMLSNLEHPHWACQLACEGHYQGSVGRYLTGPHRGPATMRAQLGCL